MSALIRLRIIKFKENKVENDFIFFLYLAANLIHKH